MTDEPPEDPDDDLAGRHGTLLGWHAGCPCSWCTARAVEGTCTCRKCRVARHRSPYVQEQRPEGE